MRFRPTVTRTRPNYATNFDRCSKTKRSRWKKIRPASPPAGTGSTLGEANANFRAEQNLPVGVVAGLGAALVGAVAWAAITFAMEYQIGYMAIAVGFLVGFAVRLGKGTDKIFGIVGAVFALAGCLLGNFLSIILFACKQEHMNVFTALTTLDYTKVPAIMSDSFSPMDLLFYGIAVYEGYRFWFRPMPAPEQGALGQS